MVIAQFEPKLEPYQVLQFWVSVDQGVMVMKEYSTFFKPQELEPDHQIVYCHILDPL